MGNEIKIGDEVTVHFWPMLSDIVGEVRYMPQSPGDSWIIEGKDGSTNYVQHFASIVKQRPPSTDDPF